MRITGTGISPQIYIKIKPDFKPKTTLALQWVQAANGNWFATDRGAASDVYDADIRLYGREAAIDAFMTGIEDNRAAGSNVLNLDYMNSTEHIFGENVDHPTFSGSLSATVLSMGKKTQNTWKGFSVTAKLRNLSPSFSGASASLPLLNLEVGFGGDSDMTIQKLDSYTGAFTYQDHERDIGLFRGTFVLSISDMQEFRNKLRITRGGTIAVSAIGGVASMFGPRRGSYPHNVKVIQWEDLGMRDVGRWRVRAVLAEHV